MQRKAIKARQRSSFEREATEERTIPTCEKEAEILLLFSVLISIITCIEVKYYYLLGLYVVPPPYEQS